MTEDGVVYLLDSMWFGLEYVLCSLEHYVDQGHFKTLSRFSGNTTIGVIELVCPSAIFDIIPPPVVKPNYFQNALTIITIQSCIY